MSVYTKVVGLLPFARIAKVAACVALFAYDCAMVPSASCSLSLTARSSARCMLATAASAATLGSSMLTPTSHSAVVRGEGVGDKEGLPLRVVPAGMGELESVGVKVTAAREGEVVRVEEGDEPMDKEAVGVTERVGVSVFEGVGVGVGVTVAVPMAVRVHALADAVVLAVEEAVAASVRALAVVEALLEKEAPAEGETMAESVHALAVAFAVAVAEAVAVRVYALFDAEALTVDEGEALEDKVDIVVGEA